MKDDNFLWRWWFFILLLWVQGKVFGILTGVTVGAELAIGACLGAFTWSIAGRIADTRQKAVEKLNKKDCE